MILFIKGLLIGLGKIIPGVSGALLAINFGVYEKLITALTTFSSNFNRNIKFILPLFAGIIIAIVLGSNIIIYLFNNYQFITLLFFIGLIIGGLVSFTKEIKFTFRNSMLILAMVIIFLILNINKTSYIYQLHNNIYDNLIFFIGGIIEIMASIIPGVSATSLLMLLGIYEHILSLVANIYNFSYVINHLNMYFSYGLGMFISFIINIYLIAYLLKKHPYFFKTLILCLSILSILFLIFMTFKLPFTITQLIIGALLFALGLLLAILLDK